jgi:uncharacterized membrane protein YeiH
LGGGAVRDIVLRKVPTVLGGNTLYATCAIAASGVLVLLSNAGHQTVGSLAALGLGAGLCLLARWRGWMLPDADAWSPARVVPRHYRERLHRRSLDPDGDPENGASP